jgi:tetraacyldisaccharide 4'-kinase
VGNMVAGGAGKTPVALALMELIQKQNLAKAPYFLTRGYGGSECGPVQAAGQTSDQIGDESLLLARHAPTIVSANRAAGGKLAAAQGADLIVMDDGLQNPGIAKDLRFVVIDGTMGFGNGKLLPAGPLRAPLDKNLKSANAFVLIGDDTRNIKEMLPPRTPVFEATLQVITTPDASKRYIAFAGIGYPEKFFNFLTQDVKLNVIENISFPDHLPYSTEDIDALKQKAKLAQAELITTEKDFMRIPAAAREDLHVLPVRLAWKEEAALAKFLELHLQ